ESYGELQWGRPLSRAESLVADRDGGGGGSASMGPPSFESGKVTIQSPRRRCVRRFNGAALFRERKGSARTRRNTAWLTRFNGAALIRERKGDHGVRRVGSARLRRAGMGPPSVESGKTRARARLHAPCTGLQGGPPPTGAGSECAPSGMRGSNAPQDAR